MTHKYYSANPIIDENGQWIISTGDAIDINGNTITIVRSNKSYTIEDPELLNKILDGCSETPEDEEDFNNMPEDNHPTLASISRDLYYKLEYLGIIDDEVRSHNVGTSNYSKHLIQPWTIWRDYNLDPWDADIIKRVLRTKSESGKSINESRIMDYQKIIHICQEKIRQLTCNNDCD